MSPEALLDLGMTPEELALEQKIEALEQWFDDRPESEGCEANYPEFRDLCALYGLRGEMRAYA
jgi:hypothetical protein